MNASEIVDLIKAQFPNAVLAAFPADKHPRVHVSADAWREVAVFLHSDPRLKLDWLACLSGMDYAADHKLAVVYDLFSLDLKHTFAVKVFCDRANPHIPSVQDLWPAANWQEREAFDMFGILFDGHPNLSRILCDENWVGFPLRKDYVFPKEYQGIPGSPSFDWDPSSKPAAK